MNNLYALSIKYKTIFPKHANFLQMLPNILLTYSTDAFIQREFAFESFNTDKKNM